MSDPERDVQKDEDFQQFRKRASKDFPGLPDSFWERLLVFQKKGVYLPPEGTPIPPPSFITRFYRKLEGVTSSWPEFLTSFATGYGIKTGARLALSATGPYTWVAAISVGALGGAGSAAVREYMRQRRTIDLGEEKETGTVRAGLKNEFKRLKKSDKEKIVKAVKMGLVTGAFGATLGALAAEVGHNEWVQQRVQELIHRISVMLTPHASIMMPTVVHPTPMPEHAIAYPTQTPEHTLVPHPTSTAIPTETPPAAPTPEHVISPSHIPPSTPEMPPSSPSIAPGIHELIPHKTDTINLPQGSGPWSIVNHYLEENLGFPADPHQVTVITNHILAENGIIDPTKIPAGTPINIAPANDYLREVLAAHPLTERVASLPDKISLNSGSSIWEKSAQALRIAGVANPSHEQIAKVAIAVCRENNIASEGLGVVGQTPDTEITSGRSLKFDAAKTVIMSLVTTR